MANNMSTQETFKFIELYQSENCLWNPKNKHHKNKNAKYDSWKRIADAMCMPVHELKKKKDNLLTTFRINLKKRKSSIKSGAGTDDVFQPIWIFYDAMAAFLTDVYESVSVMNSEVMIQPALSEEASTSNIQASDIPLEATKGDDDDAYYPAIAKNPNIRAQKRRAFNPPELQKACRKMNTALTTLNSALANKQSAKEDDECDLFCKMLAKQIKEYPKLEREEIMYELHGVMLNRRRQYERIMQDRSFTVSSPSQIILSHPSTRNSVYSSTSSPEYKIDCSTSQNILLQPTINQEVEITNILSQEIVIPETTSAVYGNLENMMKKC